MPSFKDTTAPIPPSRKETKFQGSRFGPARQLVTRNHPEKLFHAVRLTFHASLRVRIFVSQLLDSLSQAPHKFAVRYLGLKLCRCGLL